MSRADAFLRDPRVARVSAIVLLQYFAVEWVVSATWRGEYAYRTDTVGPLGIPFCGPQGTWPCSALYPAMNVSFVITGLAIAVIGGSWLIRRAVAVPAGGALAIAGGALVVAGVITEKTDYPVHVTAMTVFYVFGALSCLLIGVSGPTRLPKTSRTALTIGGGVATVAYFCFAGGLTAWLGSGGTERAIIYGILVGLLVAGVAGTSAAPDRRRAGAHRAEDRADADAETTELATTPGPA
ncbi:DUF998 domain-containing protein [Gordonia sp. OPL2]|uniref:DUF998 domain-containing protein n=1 Tax=Gordonia sp. OPL2 TaxID=2486274 RepID=UPI0016566C17|nr:DUF998 domain-containing protein [Gordonia sp. OPL2]RPA02605.1 DUF998 domain-containing protein [Gordonia sp. OPL2]